jgi:DNA-binding NarL/FixJ family response regulator
MLLKKTYSYNVLLVEDNLPLNYVLNEVITNAGHNVFAYESAEAIPDTLEYDIAVLDLNLPGEDGISLASRIKAKRSEVGVVLMTIRSGLSDRLKGYNVGADIYLSKPVDPNELLAVLNSLANRMAPRLNSKESEVIKSVPLSDKELTLLKYISRGFSYSESATMLEVSLSTVQSHIRSIYLKLGAHSKLEAIQKAKNRLIL